MKDLSTLTTNDPECWLPILNYEQLYSVSSWGRVRSEYRQIEFMPGRFRSVSSRILKSTNLNGYRQVALFNDGKRKTIRIHRLVAQSFISNPNDLPVVNHLDGDKANNEPNNLQWCTTLENNIHALETGLSPTGEHHHNFILTDIQVNEIRKRYTGVRGEQTRLAEEYGVTPQTIHFIIHNKSRNYC